MPQPRNAYRPVVMGAPAHPLASMAGIRVLLEGGNAVDAAVAVGSTLTTSRPRTSPAPTPRAPFSVTRTLGVPFGSGFAGPGTALVLNNILKWMDRERRGGDS